MPHEIIKSDGSTLENPIYKDLISNLTLFNQAYSPTRLSDLEDFNDDSDYSTYPTLESVLEEYDPETYIGKTFTVRVAEEYIFSSDAELGGYDRPKWLLKKSNDDRCRENLRTPLNGHSRGWHESDANTLNGWIRVQEHPSDNIGDALGVNGKTYQFILVKNMGNHRFWMKKIANRGGRCEYLIKIQFHELSTTTYPISLDEYISIEATGHNQDADARASQNEEQKFVSSYRSGCPEVVDCFNFLKEQKVEYYIDRNQTGIMQLEGFNEDGDWPVLSSVQGLRNGLNNGLFKKYRESNIRWAFKTLKEVCKITGENEFTYSSINVIALMYRSLTDDHSRPGYGKMKALFKKEQLHRFFVALYRLRVSYSADGFGPSPYSNLSDLSQSQGMKSFPYIASVAFWPMIQSWYKKNVNNGDGSKGFSDSNPCMRYFIDQADSFVKPEVKKLVS